MVRHMPCTITVVSVLDKWWIRSRGRALAKPRVHHHNWVSMMRKQVVARSLVSPDNGVQQYHLWPLAICNDTVIP